MFNGDAEAAQQLWDELKHQAQTAARSRDKAIAAAGKALTGLLNDMWNDKRVTYSIQVINMDEGMFNEHGGGVGACLSSSQCFVGISGNRTPLAGPETTLAHEAGGVWGEARGRGIDHYSIGGAVKWENYARTIFGCEHRKDHSVAPTMCR